MIALEKHRKRSASVTHRMWPIIRVTVTWNKQKWLLCMSYFGACDVSFSKGKTLVDYSFLCEINSALLGYSPGFCEAAVHHPTLDLAHDHTSLTQNPVHHFPYDNLWKVDEDSLRSESFLCCRSRNVKYCTTLMVISVIKQVPTLKISGNEKWQL